jgi:transposase
MDSSPPAAQLLQTVPGIGVLTATALVAFVGDIHRFRSGRHFAAYLGLTPRERSRGTVRRLGAITKQGHSYLAGLTQRDCTRIAKHRNTRPRERLGYRTPEEVYAP